MSQGTPRVVLRIPPLTRIEIEIAIKSANKAAGRTKYDLSSWIRMCIAAKLRHLERSKSKHHVDDFDDLSQVVTWDGLAVDLDLPST